MLRHIHGLGLVPIGPHLTPRSAPPVAPRQWAACEHCGEPVEKYASTTFRTLGPANTLTGRSGREQYWCAKCHEVKL